MCRKIYLIIVQIFNKLQKSRGLFVGVIDDQFVFYLDCICSNLRVDKKHFHNGSELWHFTSQTTACYPELSKIMPLPNNVKNSIL